MRLCKEATLDHGDLLGDALMIDANKRQVLWFSENGANLLKVFSCEQVPIGACLCQFSDVDRSDLKHQVIAILVSPVLLRLHPSTGDSFDILLPHPMSELYSIPSGLLFYREHIDSYDGYIPGIIGSPKNSKSNRMSFSPTSVTTKNDDKVIPIMFVLSNPLTFLSPLSICLTSNEFDARDKLDLTSNHSALEFSCINTASKPSVLATPMPTTPSKFSKTMEDVILNIHDKYVCTIAKDGSGTISLWSIETLTAESAVDITAASLDKSISGLAKNTTVVMDTTGYISGMNTSGVSSTSANSIGSLGAISRKVKSYSPNIFNTANPQSQFSSISGFAGAVNNPLDALTNLLGSGYQQKESGNMLRTGSPNIFSYNNGRNTPTLFGRNTPVGDVLAQANVNQGGSSPSLGAMSIDKDVTSERITYNSAVNALISQPELDPSFCLVLRGTYAMGKSGLVPFNKINAADIKCIFIDKIDDSNVLLLHLHHISGATHTLEYCLNSHSATLNRLNHTIYSQHSSSSSTCVSCSAIAHATISIGISRPYTFPISILFDQLNSVPRLSYMIGTKLLYSTPLEWIDDLSSEIETVSPMSHVSISSLHNGQNRYFLLHCQDSQVILSLRSTLFGNVAYCNQDIAIILLEMVKDNQMVSIPIESILALMIFVETNVGEEHVIPCLLYSLFLDDSYDLPDYFSLSTRELILSTRSACNAEGDNNVGAIIFDVLHSCWEDLILRSSRVSAMIHLGTALRNFLSDTLSSSSAEFSMIAADYCNHYSRTLNRHTSYEFTTNHKCCGVFKPFTCCSTVPDVTNWLCLAISALHNNNLAPVFPFPSIIQSISYSRSYQSIRFCYNLIQECLTEMRKSNHFKHAINFAFTLANSFVRHSAGDISALELVPIELKYIVEMALFQCKPMNGDQNMDVNIRGNDNIGDWPDNMLTYIGRPDLCRNTSSKSRITNNIVDNKNQSGQPTSASGQSDGLADVESAAHQLRFGEDDRVHEVCRMLRSSKHIYLRVERTPENSDLEHRSKLQMRLLTLCRRTFAACVGRGMLTMGSLEPLMAESLPIPTLMLSGRVPPQNVIIALETTHAPSELTLWPEFHNGVAAGLRVGSIESRGFKQTGFNNSNVPVRVTRNWIIYNRTASVGNEAAHAGFLLALGLQGYLNVLSVTDICDYLTQGHEPTTVALLVGMAAAKAGSADTLLSKTLCLHLPALLPPRINCDIEISPIVQTAALTGLGLLHAGSGHRLMTEFLLAEISRKPTSDCCETREAMAISVSWALGMVLLAKGSKNIELGIGPAGNIPSEGLSGLADLHIEDRLFQHIVGGKRPTESHLFPLASLMADVNSKSSRILEGEDINVNVTAPGATIALAMIYIKSNNLEIMRRLALPTTSFDIDAIRPDLLLFRAISICLVMWDKVEPSETWIENQVPECITSVLYSAPSKALVIPYKKNSSSDNKLSAKSSLGAYLCIITGYCVGIGLVFAGTSNESAKLTILAKLKVLQCLRDNKVSKLQKFQNVSVDKAMKPLIEMCVSCTTVALSYVMAGTGDLTCLRIFRELRWRVDDVNYGSHMSIGMAIGMLFLAGGNASLKRDPFSISCLLLSICPRFPMRTADNQYHLQPLRHMYVLAVESRALRTVDIDSGVSVPLNVTIEMNDGTILAMRAPCLVPELTTIKSVLIMSEENGDQYYSKRFSFVRGQGDVRYNSLPPLFVKRKSAISTGNIDDALMEKAALNSFLHIMCSSMHHESGSENGGIKQVLGDSPHVMSILYKSMKEV